jgi:hypothetical protein
MAEQIRQGRLPRDPYRPMLYPLLTAAVGGLVGDCFVAGRLVSSAAAGVFLAVAALLVRRCFGGAVAVVTALFLAANGHVLVSGVQASTDMLFTALATIALWLAVRTAADPHRRNVVGLAAACAMAYWTRYTAVLLLVPALGALWSAPTGGRGRWRRVALFAVAGTCFLTPHMVASVLSFGAPFHDQSWRNVALKHFGGMDYSRIDQLPFSGLLPVLLHDPAAFARRSLSDLVGFGVRGAPGMLEGVEPAGWAGVTLALLAGAGVIAALRHARSPYWIVLAHAVLYVLAVCVLFVPIPRVVLVTLPAWYAAAAFALERSGGSSPVRRALASAAALALLAGVALQAPATIRDFRARLPWAEVATARELNERASHPFRGLCTYGAMWRIAPNFQFVPPPYGAEDLAGYLQRLVAAADEARAEYILLGALALGPTDFARLSGASHPRLELERRDADILVLRVKDVALDWVESGRAWLSGPGRLSVEVVLRAGVAPELVHSVHVVATGPSGQRVVLPLERTAARGYATVQEGFTIEHGVWSLVPVVVDADARTGAGTPFSFVAR